MIKESIGYASGASVSSGWRRRRMVVAGGVAFVLAYVGTYVVIRSRVEPAMNLAYFVYPGSEAVDRWCYYGFWPVYKVDRWMTGRKHNRDRVWVVVPER